MARIREQLTWLQFKIKEFSLVIRQILTIKTIRQQTKSRGSSQQHRGIHSLGVVQHLEEVLQKMIIRRNRGVIGVVEGCKLKLVQALAYNRIQQHFVKVGHLSRLPLYIPNFLVQGGNLQQNILIYKQQQDQQIILELEVIWGFNISEEKRNTICYSLQKKGGKIFYRKVNVNEKDRKIIYIWTEYSCENLNYYQRPTFECYQFRVNGLTLEYYQSIYSNFSVNIQDSSYMMIIALILVQIKMFGVYIECTFGMRIRVIKQPR
ncbi:unnamed protein product [Paramecium octaurelia]|uniref:Transmembrane protein n=1 Tax=Paramecium octaurelia TaxID=43137 RepID=A0A8S1YQ78_PAROT|nr:unnamed protein product [Paramecium octaurelia]